MCSAIRPSKAWVLGSSPNGITFTADCMSMTCSFFYSKEFVQCFKNVHFDTDVIRECLCWANYNKGESTIIDASAFMYKQD